MEAPTSFEAVQSRLDEIVEAVNAEGVTLDEALALYEEAVKLGLAACDLSEQDALEAAGMLDEQAPAGGDLEAPAAPDAASADGAADAQASAPAASDAAGEQPGETQ